jgi:hypothetical protein
MLSFAKVSNEIILLVASFVSILHGKNEISSTSFHQWKYYQIFHGSHYTMVELLLEVGWEFFDKRL